MGDNLKTAMEEKQISHMAQERVVIFDTTMRDGEQSPGASMSLEEKLVMLHGDTNKTGGLPYVGNVPGNTRLKIPPLTLNDGPQVKCARPSLCRRALYLRADCSSVH